MQKPDFEVPSILLDHSLCAEMAKCIFNATEVLFLGFMASGKELGMDPDTVKSIVDWPMLTNPNEVQQLLRLWNFYQRFVPSYAAIVTPITHLLR